MNEFFNADPTAKKSGDPNEDASFLVVGIGASAGGIQALTQFFARVRDASGIAYVVILHLSPDHDSQLAHLLQNTTNMPVMQVERRLRVVPDHVYVIPPNKTLEINNGYLEISEVTSIEVRRAPVDIFFRTLAESHHERAVAVVLSGTGANGSMGIKRVKERGGCAIVQDPKEAEYGEMPKHSLATGLVDSVLPVAEIPNRIVAYRDSLRRLRLSDVEQPDRISEEPQTSEAALRDILTQLRVRTGHDFSNYKRATVLRRIGRRMVVHELPNLSAYAQFMHERPQEANALLKDLLISVTNFFRDATAFEALERDVIPKLFEGKGPDDPVRVWVAGCATGEEAYSVMMLLADYSIGLPNPPQIQVFATDIDTDAIAVARDGVYTLNDAADISPERLSRYFVRERDNAYRVRREIRECVLFAVHDVIKNPPFAHLDLVTCRNLLIYLNQKAQRRVMDVLHFALNPGGFLMLGESESVDGASDLYAAVDKEHRMYQGRAVDTRLVFPIPDGSLITRLGKLPQLRQFREMHGPSRSSYSLLHQRLLERYAPPSLVVNEDYDVVHMSESAGHYLELQGGELSPNLLNLIRPELRLELRSSLYQAAQKKIDVESQGVALRVGGKTEIIKVKVKPVLNEEDKSRGFMVVLFEEQQEGAAVLEREQEGPEGGSGDQPIVRQLEAELYEVKAQLSATIEQHELQREELKASNEEFQAMNEEMRSAAEELETSKEELQSINEELTTVNQELKIKIEELGHSNDNFKNLINSTQIGTVFLDRDLRVKLFTPRARDIFNLIGTDAGRPLSDITSKLLDNSLVVAARTVLDTLQSIEREVRTADEHTYLMQIVPYRTMEDRIDGVVITFFDITGHKRAEEAVAEELRGTRILQRLAARLVTPKNIQTIYDEIMTAAIEITRADAGTLQMLDPETHELVFLSASNIDAEMSEYFCRVDASSNTACAIALQTGERSFVDFDQPDIDDTDGAMQMHVKHGLLSAQSTPLIARSGRPLGMVSTHWRKSHHRPSERELRFLDLLARQAADLVELLNFIQTQRESEAKLEVELADNQELQRISTALFRADNIEALNERILEAALSVTRADFASLQMYDGERGELSLLSHIGFGAKTAEHWRWTKFDDSSAWARAMANENRIVIRDVETCDFLAGTDDLDAYRLSGIRAVQSTRLVSRSGRLVGILSTHWGKPHNPSERELRLLDVLARQAADVIDRHAAQEALRASEIWLASQKEAFQSAVNGAPLETSLGMLVRTAVEQANTDVRYAFYIVNEAGTELHRVAGMSKAYAETMDGFKIAADSLACGLAAATGRPVITPDVTRDPRWKDWLWMAQQHDYRAVWSFPIETAEGKVVGAFELYFTHPRDATPRDHEFAAVFTKAAAIIISRTQMIEEHARAERALHEAQERLRLASTVTGFGIQDYDVANDSLYWSRELKEMVGLGPARDLTFKSLLQLIHPEDRERMERTMQHALDPEGPGRFEAKFRVVRPDNAEILWLYSRSHTIFTGEGEARKPVRNTGVVIDITERNRTDEPFMLGGRLRMLLDSASEFAIFTLTLDGRINSWSAGAEKIFGWTEEEAIGQSGEIIFTPEDRTNGGPEKEMETALREGRAPDERWHVRKDGTRFFVSGVMQPLRDLESRVVGFAKIAYDISEQKQAEEDLRRAYEQMETRVRERTFELAQANESLRDEISQRIQIEKSRVRLMRQIVRTQEDERRRIARDIHDQLGQQMTALRLSLAGLEQGCSDDDGLRSQLDQTKALAERLDADVDFLAWELRPAALDDIGLVEALGNYVREWSQYSGIEAQFHTSGMDKERLAPESETNLYRITQEALNNTMKYAKAKRADVLLERRDHQVVLIVEDDGVGFDPKKAMESDGDKGLGLVGMRERAMLVGGNLEIESNPTKGTTIFARVPVQFIDDEDNGGE
jgi:PAS domain S-box-containing protein